MPKRPRPATRRRHTKRTPWLLAAIAIVLLASACGSSKKDVDAKSSTTSRSATTVASVAGCADGFTDPTDRSPDRESARCDSGAPAPKPLAKKTKLVVTSSTWSAEFTSAVVYAQKSGEFAKENLDVELKVVPPADQITLLGTGKTDAAYTGPDAAFVNGISSGFDLRWVAANYSSPAASKTGLWVTSKDGKADVAALKGKTVVSAVGNGSVATYPMEEQLEKAGLTLKDITLKQLPPADVVPALQNGAAAGGWVLDPYWTQLEDSSTVAFAGGQPLAEPLGGLMFGPSILEKDRAKGEAFVRAYVRTISTYFDGDYKADDAFMKQLATYLDVDQAILQSTPSPVWDWEIRSGTMERLQKTYQEGGALKGEPMPESEIVDRSFTDAAVGHSS